MLRHFLQTFLKQNASGHRFCVSCGNISLHHLSQCINPLTPCAAMTRPMRAMRAQLA